MSGLTPSSASPSSAGPGGWDVAARQLGLDPLGILLTSDRPKRNL